MFFSVFVGPESGGRSWQRAMASHARWLGVSVDCESRRFHDRRVLRFAGLGRENRSAGRCLVGTGDDVTVFGDGTDGNRDQTNSPYLFASLRTGRVQAVVPPTTPQQLFFASACDGCVFSDDLRMFPRLCPAQLDDEAIFALFQYGAIPPDASMFRAVRRIPNGHDLVVEPGSSEPEYRTVFFSAEQPAPDLHEDVVEAWLPETLDRVVQDVPRATVLYFSGGVDSGLLAARLVGKGRNDVQLVNYSFGTKDEEAAHARRVAGHLGLRCHQVQHHALKVGGVLNRLGKDYTFPFGDSTTIPMNILVHESLKFASESRTVLEGTGADGAFGIAGNYPLWKRVYGLPRGLRTTGRGVYSALSVWKRRSRLESLLQFMRKSVKLSLEHTVVAQNALNGIAYKIPSETERRISEALRRYVEVMSDGVAPEERLSLLDLVFVCAGRMAAKSFDPLRSHGVRAVYPYLQPALVSMSARVPWDIKCANGVAKAILKKLASRQIPRGWVYRPKSGFTPPHVETFSCDAIQGFFRDVVLSAENPLLQYCERRMVARMIDAAKRHEPMGRGTYDFLWALAFTSGWLMQVPNEMPKGESSDDVEPPMLLHDSSPSLRGGRDDVESHG